MEELKMEEKLRKAIDKLKNPKQEEEEPEPEEIFEEDDEPEQQEEVKKPQIKKELTEEEKNRIMIAQRMNELQNNGIYRLELLHRLGEISHSMKVLNQNIAKILK